MGMQLISQKFNGNRIQTQNRRTAEIVESQHFISPLVFTKPLKQCIFAALNGRSIVAINRWLGCESALVLVLG